VTALLGYFFGFAPGLRPTRLADAGLTPASAFGAGFRFLVERDGLVGRLLFASEGAFSRLGFGLAGAVRFGFAGSGVSSSLTVGLAWGTESEMTRSFSRTSISALPRPARVRRGASLNAIERSGDLWR